MKVRKVDRPNIQRFVRFIREIATPDLVWEYGNGDDMVADAKAFLREYRKMKRVLQIHACKEGKK